MPTFQDTRNTSDGYVHTNYKKLDNAAADAKAIEDIKEYLGSINPEVFDMFVELATAIEARDPKYKFGSLNMQFGIAGVSGYPFHAFCRKYCLQAYREWMGGGSDPIETDANGFNLAEGS